jgi:hypothetical protein
MNLVQSDPELINDTVLILTSDHGGIGTGHDSVTNPANYTIPVLVWGAGVAAGVDLYAVNSDTRGDPGTARPNYSDANQPIRNGDTGNLAMDLLGLGSVPGSTINVMQNLRVWSVFSADFNGDLSVNDADLAVWQVHVGTSALAHAVKGDADGDRDVDGRDFLIWQRQYGNSAAGVASIVVPEPTPGRMLITGFGIYPAVRRTVSRRCKSS